MLSSQCFLMYTNQRRRPLAARKIFRGSLFWGNPDFLLFDHFFLTVHAHDMYDFGCSYTVAAARANIFPCMSVFCWRRGSGWCCCSAACTGSARCTAPFDTVHRNIRPALFNDKIAKGLGWFCNAPTDFSIIADFQIPCGGCVPEFFKGPACKKVRAAFASSPLTLFFLFVFKPIKKLRVEKLPQGDAKDLTDFLNGADRSVLNSWRISHQCTVKHTFCNTAFNGELVQSHSAFCQQFPNSFCHCLLCIHMFHLGFHPFMDSVPEMIFQCVLYIEHLLLLKIKCIIAPGDCFSSSAFTSRNGFDVRSTQKAPGAKQPA